MTPVIEEGRDAAAVPGSRERVNGSEGVARLSSGAPRRAALAALLAAATRATLRVVAREQDLRHARGRATRRGACSGGTPGAPSSASLKDSSSALSSWPSAPGQLAQHRVADHHRRQLAARQHVGADRDHVGRQVLVHPLVEALVAPAQQRQLGLRGQLVGERVVEAAARPPPARSRAASRALGRIAAVARRAAPPPPRPPAPPSRRRRRTACRRPGPPPSGVVARRSTTSSSWPSSSALRTWRCSRNQSNQLREQREDVDLHSAPSGQTEELAVHLDDPRASRVDALDRVGDERDERAVASTSSTAQEGAVEHAPRRRRARHLAADQVLGRATRPPRAAPRRRDQQRLPAQGRRGVAVDDAAQPDQRPRVGAGAALHPLLASPTVTTVPVRQRMRRAARRRSCRRGRAAGRRARRGTRRSHGASIHHVDQHAAAVLRRAAFITVRSAVTVRPPRPITLPASSSAT